jgi:hypothetical protein
VENRLPSGLTNLAGRLRRPTPATALLAVLRERFSTFLEQPSESSTLFL